MEDFNRVTSYTETNDSLLPFPISKSNLSIFVDDAPGDKKIYVPILLLVCTMMGSGTLLIPYCYSIGWFLSLCVSFSFFVIYSSALMLMVDSASITHRYDFDGLFSAAFSPNYVWIVHSMIFLVQWGTCVIYCHWFGVLANDVVQHFGEIAWTLILTVLIMIPLTLLKSIASLHYFTWFNFSIILLLIFHSIYWFFASSEQDIRSTTWLSFDTKPLITSFSVYSTAFSCSVNLFSCLRHLENCTKKRANIVIFGSGFITFTLYSIFAFFAYFSKWLTLSAGKSIIEDYPNDHILTKIVTGGIAIMLIICGPLVIWGARNSIHLIFLKDRHGYFIFALTGIVLALTAAGVAVSERDLILYFDLVGGLFTPPLSLLLPAFFYMKTVPKKSLIKKILALLCGLISLTSMIFCTYQAITELINSKKNK